MRREIYTQKIFDVPESTVIFLQIAACMKWTSTPTKRKALNVNTISKIACNWAAYRITSLFALINFEVK